MELFRAAARRGHAGAQFALAQGYFNGNGVPQDYVQAAHWFRQAADQGLAEAQSNLGDLYRMGDKGVAQDFVESFKWYRKAAEQGHALSQSNVGAFYERGIGVGADGVEAVKWYTRAAEQGFPLAQYNLGLVYADGKSVAADAVEAHKWLNLAAARGGPENQQAFAATRDKVGQTLTPAQMADAQRRAREWLDAFERRSAGAATAPSSVPAQVPAAEPAPAPVPLPPPPPAPQSPPAAVAPPTVSLPPPAVKPIRVGAGIATPAKRKHVEPVYPPVAVSARVQGVVFLEITISADGYVDETKVLRSPSPLLEPAAVAAVRQWQYEPTLLNGVRVPVMMTVYVTFALK
jgi:TonB family protein